MRRTGKHTTRRRPTMSVLDRLSSQTGDRTAASNRKGIAECLARPALLAEIAEGLAGKDAALLGDCAEVLTEVAKERPEWIAPYAGPLAGLLTHTTTRVRWEATHALALVAAQDPAVIPPLLPHLAQMIHDDASVIVRDYAVDAVGNYAATSEAAAQAACPVLVASLPLWNGKQAAHVLEGLVHVVSAAPGLGDELRPLGERYLDDGRARVRKAAKALVKATG